VTDKVKVYAFFSRLPFPDNEFDSILLAGNDLRQSVIEYLDKLFDGMPYRIIYEQYAGAKRRKRGFFWVEGIKQI